jgi:hypothetical protein
MLSGQQINVDASLHYWGSVTATIYGPHEYLHPIGPLDAGEYRLTLNLATSSVFDSTEPSIATGYIDFVVHPVPEPSAALFIATFAAVAAASPRLSKRENKGVRNQINIGC